MSVTNKKGIMIRGEFLNEDYLKSDAVGYNIGEYLYHVTPKQNLNTIKSEGFIPKDGVGINNKPFNNRLYFATSLISAYDIITNFNSYKDDSDYVIFKIKASCVNNGYENDTLFKHGIYVDYPITSDCIINIVNYDDLFGKFNDDDFDKLY